MREDAAGMVEHHQIGPVVANPQAAADCLQVIGEGLGGAQEDDAADVRAIDTCYPQLSIADHVDVAGAQAVQRLVALFLGGPA